MQQQTRKSGCTRQKRIQPWLFIFFTCSLFLSLSLNNNALAHNNNEKTNYKKNFEQLKQKHSYKRYFHKEYQKYKNRKSDHDDDHDWRQWRSEKIIVCHYSEEGETKNIHINKKALPAHLRHGDYLGECTPPTFCGDGHWCIFSSK